MCLWETALLFAWQSCTRGSTHPCHPHPPAGPSCPTTLQQALEVELGLLVQLLHAWRAPGCQEDVHWLLP